MMKSVTAVIIGAGNRGKIYSRYAKEYPDKFEIVGVAEPRQHAREYMMKTFSLPLERCYEKWEDLCKEDKFSDCAVICTQDQQHVDAAVSLAKKGYNILLEKPMAVTPEDCKSIYKACRNAGVMLCVCHVLRYHPCVIKLKEVIDSGVIGEVVNITHTEPVGFWHFAHSFVRGNWRNTSQSTFSLLAKCCHDVDLIAYWMNFQKCTHVSSFGSLMHFRKENKPKGAASRCLECPSEKDCPYSAKKIYLDPKPIRPAFPVAAVCDIEDSNDYLSHLTTAVKNGPYGKCVYDTDNDVCDNQVVNFMFENGATANLTMIAYTKDVCQRKVSIYGTKGELRWDDLFSHQITHYDFLTRTSSAIQCCHMEAGSPHSWGLGGSDYYTIKSFVDAISKDKKEVIRTGPKESLYSHLLTFAAEKSRLSGKVINLEEDELFTDIDH